MSKFTINAGGFSSLPMTQNMTGNQFGPVSSAPEYCENPNTVASQYRLNADAGSAFVPYTMTLDGITVPVYSLERGAPGPALGQSELYQSAPFEKLLAGVPTAARCAVDWLLANTYPATSVECTFVQAGVDEKITPPLDEADAYAVVQTAIWRALFQVMPNQIWFLDCATGAPHVKNPRLVSAVTELINQARAFGESIECAPCAGQRTGCDKQPDENCPVRCFGVDALPANPAEPYITFVGCPVNTRFDCGRLIIGPLQLESNLNGVPVVTGVSVGTGQDRWLTGNAVDACGVPISPPEFGQVFYLDIRVPDDVHRLKLCATVTDCQVTQVNILGNVDEARWQRLAVPLVGQTVTVTTSATLDISKRTSFGNISFKWNAPWGIGQMAHPDEARQEEMNPFRPWGGDRREWNPFHPCCDPDRVETFDEMDGDMRIYRGSRARRER